MAEQVESLAANRLIIFIHKNPTNDEERSIAELGGADKIMKMKAIGGANTPLETLTRLKTWVKEGRAAWLRIQVGPEHMAQPKWVSQTCRLAARAGVQWDVEFTTPRPWALPQFEQLRKQSYVQEHRGLRQRQILEIVHGRCEL